MFTAKEVQLLLSLEPPVLTAYVRTGAVDKASHSLASGYLAWIESQSRTLAKTVPSSEQAAMKDQIERVLAHLKKRQSHEKSLVIVAAPKVWTVVPLQTDVEAGLYWGKPALAQLFSLASEHKPYGVVAVDHKGIRFFVYSLGEIDEQAEKKFSIDASQWKSKTAGHVKGQKILKSSGSRRAVTVFEKRIKTQFAHLLRDAADEAARFCERQHLAAAFLTGPARFTKEIHDKLPRECAVPFVLLDEDLTRAKKSDLKKHIEAAISAWEGTHELELVHAAIEEEPGVIAGFDETLAQLQKGRIRKVVLARGLDPILHQCVECGWMDRSADAVCSVCGGKRRTISLWDTLPELAKTQNAEIDVVSNAAAAQLKNAEGMAGWLRPSAAMAATTKA